MKKTRRALAYLLTILLVMSIGTVAAYAAPYSAQGIAGQTLTMLTPSDITVNSADEDDYYRNTINTALDPSADIVFNFTLSSGMNNFTETLFTTTNLPLITVCSSYGGTVVVKPTFVSGSSASISISIPAGALTDGTYFLVFGKDIQGNNSSKILGKDIAFEFTANTGAAPITSPFTDVPDWAKNYVAAVAETGCITGLTETSFGPDIVLTRGEFVTILGKARGIKIANYATSAFVDITETDTCSPYAAWAASKNIVVGYGDNVFGPNDKLTREQVVTMLYRYAEAFAMDTEATGSTAAFSDSMQTSSWAGTAMSWAIGHNYVNGVGTGMLVPTSHITKVQAAKLIAVVILGK